MLHPIFYPDSVNLNFSLPNRIRTLHEEKKLLSFHNAEKKLPLQFWHTTQIASVWSWWKSFRSVNHEFDHSIKKFIDTRSSWNSSRGVARVESSNRIEFDVTQVFPIACRSFMQLQSHKKKSFCGCTQEKKFIDDAKKFFMRASTRSQKNFMATFTRHHEV